MTASTVPVDAGTDAARSSGRRSTATPLPRARRPSDPAIGTAAPALTGSDYAGQAVDDRAGRRRPDDDRLPGPLVPALQRRGAGAPRVAGVRRRARRICRSSASAPAVSAERPNFPPASGWPTRAGTWPVIADDEEQTAAGGLRRDRVPVHHVRRRRRQRRRPRLRRAADRRTLQALADATVATPDARRAAPSGIAAGPDGRAPGVSARRRGPPCGR